MELIDDNIMLPSFSFLSASQPGVFDRVVVNDSVDVAYDELQRYVEKVLKNWHTSNSV